MHLYLISEKAQLQRYMLDHTNITLLLIHYSYKLTKNVYVPYL